MAVLLKLVRAAVIVGAAFSSMADAAPSPPNLKARADAILEATFPADGPGAAAIITRRGRTIYSASRGLADVEEGRAITPETIFRLGSISKQFTAAVILQLVQEGRIALDDTLAKFFPDYPQPGRLATVQQLLNHTSGIQGFDSWTEETNRPHSTAEMIARFRDLPSDAPPGQAWKYNNSGYVLLAAIIEKETGKAWHEAIEERIARPLGLRTLGYGLKRAAETTTARGYHIVGGVVKPAPRLHILHAGGGLLATASDLAKWSHALHHGQVVSPALYEAMISPTVMPDGRTQPYGFGLELQKVRERPAVGHGARVVGFVGKSIYIPSEDLFVAVLVNNGSPPPASRGIAERLAALAMDEPVVSSMNGD